jgi:hypothetical protein
MLDVYQMCGDFVSVLQDLIPEVIPSQKCHMNMCPVFSSYRHMENMYFSIWSTLYFSQHVAEYLNDQFPNWWICHDGPQNWPLQSLDLIHLDSYENVYEQKLKRKEELHHWIFFAQRHEIDIQIFVFP